MIKKFSIMLVASFATILLFDANLNTVHSNGTGAPSMKTGSIHDDGGRSCSTSGCHDSNAGLTSGPFTISSDVPAGGYMPDSTYTITVSIDSGGNVFGFGSTIQDSNGDHPGTIIITSSVTTKISSNDPNGEYVTHTVAGAGGLGSKTWTYDWTAPSITAGDVTVYTAFNQANGNFNRTGDQIYTGSLLIDAAVQVGVNESDVTYHIFPNPATNFVQVNGALNGDAFINLYDLSGKIIKSQSLNHTKQISLSDLSSGMYLLQIVENGSVSLTERIVKL